MRPKMSKVTLEPGWAEIRITMQRPVPDAPDFKVYDDEARHRCAMYLLAWVAGVARRCNAPVLERECRALYDRLQEKFEVPQ